MVGTDANAAGVATGASGPSQALRRMLIPLALAQFICSFAGSNMNVMINDISEDLDTTVQGVQIGDHAVPARHGRADDPRREADRPVGAQALLHASGSPSTGWAR